MRHKICGNKDDVLKAIDNCVVGFKAKRNKEIIIAHYLDGMTFEEIAEKFSMSVRHIKKISYDHEVIINKYLKGISL